MAGEPSDPRRSGDQDGAIAPLSHPFVERLIGTIRRECLDRTFFWTAVDLETKLLEFQHYYNGYRAHGDWTGSRRIRQAATGLARASTPTAGGHIAADSIKRRSPREVSAACWRNREQSSGVVIRHVQATWIASVDDHRHARHHSPVASPVGRAQVGLSEAARGAVRDHARGPYGDPPHGGRESDLGFIQIASANADSPIAAHRLPVFVCC